MADIFISYKREDRVVAASIAADLEAEGFTVFFDVRIRVGETWDEVIERELAEARCVVVLWSKISRDSPWVRKEARVAIGRRVLFPVYIEDCDLPLEFSDVQTARLVDRALGDRRHEDWRRLCASVSARLGDARLDKSSQCGWPSDASLHYCLRNLDQKISDLSKVALDFSFGLRNGSLFDAMKNAVTVSMVAFFFLGIADFAIRPTRGWLLFYVFLASISVGAIGINIAVSIYGCRIASMIYEKKKYQIFHRVLNSVIYYAMLVGVWFLAIQLLMMDFAMLLDLDLAALKYNLLNKSEWEPTFFTVVFYAVNAVIGMALLIVLLLGFVAPLNPSVSRPLLSLAAGFFISALSKKEKSEYIVVTSTLSTKAWGRYKKIGALERIPDALTALKSARAEIEVLAASLYNAKTLGKPWNGR